MRLICGLLIPRHGLREALLYTVAGLVQATETVLRIRQATLGSTPIPGSGLSGVASHTAATGVIPEPEFVRCNLVSGLRLSHNLSDRCWLCGGRNRCGTAGKSEKCET